ncbi:hypothetical protein VPHK251G3_0059 [Vibrio phage K251 g3]
MHKNRVYSIITFATPHMIRVYTTINVPKALSCVYACDRLMWSPYINATKRLHPWLS